MIEEGTVFYESQRTGKLRRLSDEVEAEMYDITINTLDRHGYQHYEISSFAKLSCAAKHNLVYWNNQAYIGLGPGACGYIDGARYSNIRGVQDYIDCLQREDKPIADSEKLTGRNEKAETVILGLRKRDGIRGRRTIGGDLASRLGINSTTFSTNGLARICWSGLTEISD